MKPARLCCSSAGVLWILVLFACGSSDGPSAVEPSARTQGTEDGAKPDPLLGEGGTPDAPGGGNGGRDPATCAEAAQYKTYVGCDYWPTVTANGVEDFFDFAVAVANVGADAASVTVTGPGGTKQNITVAAGGLGKIFLPWVVELKGAPGTTLMASVVAKKGAFHLVSDKPVVVYQFNPLEYHAVGGPPGKHWDCPNCNSFQNDASLLLPSTAMTGNYRIMGSQGMTRDGNDEQAPFFTVTATADNTNVEVKLAAKGKLVGGGGVPNGAGGGTVNFTLNAGDVAELVSGIGKNYDFSGSLLRADKPVQVITGVPCMDMPINVKACDHLEETVFPVETLGKHYVVMRPTGPRANDVGHVVHFYGNMDGTKLTYKPSRPAGCPDTLSAGQVVDCGVVAIDFEVSGDQSFGVGMFQLGGDIADPSPSGDPMGDPSQSFAVTVEQYRKDYVFLAPTDYKTSFVDIVASDGTTLTLDGADVSSKLKAIAGTSYFTARLQLGAGKDGAHSLRASAPIGIQVIGYGGYTSYQYPGGLNLSAISAVPLR